MTQNNNNQKPTTPPITPTTPPMVDPAKAVSAVKHLSKSATAAIIAAASATAVAIVGVIGVSIHSKINDRKDSKEEQTKIVAESSNSPSYSSSFGEAPENENDFSTDIESNFKYASDLLKPTNPKLMPHMCIDRHGYYQFTIERNVYRFNSYNTPVYTDIPDDHFYVCNKDVSYINDDGSAVLTYDGKEVNISEIYGTLLSFFFREDGFAEVYTSYNSEFCITRYDLSTGKPVTNPTPVKVLYEDRPSAVYSVEICTDGSYPVGYFIDTSIGLFYADIDSLSFTNGAAEFTNVEHLKFYNGRKVDTFSTVDSKSQISTHKFDPNNLYYFEVNGNIKEEKKIAIPGSHTYDQIYLIIPSGNSCLFVFRNGDIYVSNYQTGEAYKIDHLSELRADGHLYNIYFMADEGDCENPLIFVQMDDRNLYTYECK